MTNPFLIIVFIATLFEVFADIFLKKWSIDGKGLFLSLGILLYTIGTVAWAYSLKFELLSKAISIFTIFNLICVVLAGILVFNDSLSLTNKMGIVIGIISIILMEI